MGHVLRIFLLFSLVALLSACSNADTPEEIVNLRDACKLQPDPGPCKARMEKFYYDTKTESCSVFYYGGCQGVVPFDTLSTCQSHCESKVVSKNQCEFEGSFYGPGESWPVDCNTCVCSQTEDGVEVSCTEQVCPNILSELSETPDIYPYTVKLKYGESINTADGLITFADILEDNRCPQGVNCAWEGNAKVTLKIANEDEAPVEIHVDTLEQVEYRRQTQVNDLLVQLKHLNPSPKADQVIENDHYVIELLITENPDLEKDNEIHQDFEGA